MTDDYLKEVRKFLRYATWLTDEHAPMVHHLKKLAITLNKQLEDTGKIEQGVANVFGVTWGRLANPNKVVEEPKKGKSDPDLKFS